MMFLGLRKLGNICCGHKMFLKKSQTFFVSRTQNLCPQQMLRPGKRGNICVGNNVSATMCPRLPGPLKTAKILNSRFWRPKCWIQDFGREGQNAEFKLSPVISSCCFAEDGKDTYQNSKRTCTATVWWRSRRRRRRGLLKPPIVSAWGMTRIKVWSKLTELTKCDWNKPHNRSYDRMWRARNYFCVD